MAASPTTTAVLNDDISYDPNTNLPIVEIPHDHVKHFARLQGTVIHYFGVVDKFNRMWKPDRRVAFLSDQCVYLCKMNGDVTRCVPVRNIERVLVSDISAVGLKVMAPEHDILIRLADVQEREAVLTVLKNVYYHVVGTEMPMAKLSDESSVAVRDQFNLSKPRGFTPHVEPVRAKKALVKAIRDQQEKEKNDRKLVESEFDRIKDGLRRELQQYRTEEYERNVEQLAKHAKSLSEKDAEIERLRRETVRKDDPELWRQCPNCARLNERLSSNAHDDKQKIVRLEREIESQRHIMEHLQAAIQHRQSSGTTGVPLASSERGLGNSAGASGGTVDNGQLTTLRHELREANRKNKELQSLVLHSPVLTSDVKERVGRIMTHRDGPGSTASFTASDWADLVAERDREVRHLKAVLKDATYRHLQELDTIRAQFRQYDEQIVSYLEDMFDKSKGMGGVNTGGDHRQRALAAARAASAAAGGLPAVPQQQQQPSSNNISNAPPQPMATIATRHTPSTTAYRDAHSELPAWMDGPASPPGNLSGIGRDSSAVPSAYAASPLAQQPASPRGIPSALARASRYS